MYEGGLFIYTLSTVTLLLKLNRFLVGGVYTRDECEPYKWGPWTQSSAQLSSTQISLPPLAMKRMNEDELDGLYVSRSATPTLESQQEPWSIVEGRCRRITKER